MNGLSRRVVHGVADRLRDTCLQAIERKRAGIDARDPADYCLVDVFDSGITIDLNKVVNHRTLSIAASIIKLLHKEVIKRA